jgi:hypothetical protein
MPEILYLRALLTLLRDQLAQLRRQDPMAGSFSVETAIIAGLLALAAAGLALLIAQKVAQKEALISGA